MRKKIVQINTVCNGSTGMIMQSIQEAANNEGYETLSFYGRRNGYSDLRCEKFGNGVSFWIHVVVNTLLDKQGFASYFATKRLVRRIKEENPDIIHLHNLHGYYLNLPILFAYLCKEFKGKIYWTFHDCWPITGHCPHFVITECDKWKTCCHKCENKREYPISLGLDASKNNYVYKKKLFGALKNLVVICPSQWMLSNVKESYLKDKQGVIVPNGVDLNLFHYNPDIIKLKNVTRYLSKKIILGVASVWERRKGLDDFIKLSYYLGTEYTIILVGLTQKQIHRLPPNIVGIRRTEDKEELVALYSVAKIFLNPSKEESFSLVTIEAMACGTPVIGLDCSAVKELINEENGVLLHNHSPKDYLNAIKQCEEKCFDRSKIRDTVMQYSIDNMTNHILELYKEN